MHLWVDFVLQTEAPDFWQYDSCFEFARPVVDVADELATNPFLRAGGLEWTIGRTGTVVSGAALALAAWGLTTRAVE